MQIGISAYLQAGLPLRQYSGFSSQSEGLLGSDSKIENIQVLDPFGERIFAGLQEGHEEDRDLPLIDARTYRESRIQLKTESFSQTRIEESAESYRVILDLRDKFGDAGDLPVSNAAPSFVQLKLPSGSDAILWGLGHQETHACRRNASRSRRAQIIKDYAPRLCFPGTFLFWKLDDGGVLRAFGECFSPALRRKDPSDFHLGE